jgi:hypothetical protein
LAAISWLQSLLRQRGPEHGSIRHSCLFIGSFFSEGHGRHVTRDCSRLEHAFTRSYSHRVTRTYDSVAESRMVEYGLSFGSETLYAVAMRSTKLTVLNSA